jgi:hypothetical protein
LRPNAARRRRLEFPDLGELEAGFKPYDGHEALVVRTALIRPESYRGEETRRPYVGSTYAAARLVRHLALYDQEVVVTIAVDQQMKVSAFHEVHIGTMSSAYAQARQVLKVGLLVGATGIIMVHNHPSGDPTPSEDDGRMTANVEFAGRLLGLEVFDHIIVAERGFSDFSSKQISGWPERAGRPGPMLGGFPPVVLSAYEEPIRVSGFSYR